LLVGNATFLLLSVANVLTQFLKAALDFENGIIQRTGIFKRDDIWPTARKALGIVSKKTV
jgi:hypothetical protein